MSYEEGSERPRRGRFISFDDDDDLTRAPDPAATTRTVGRAAVASTIGLLAVAATSGWTAMAFAGRGSGDIKVTTGRTATDAAGKVTALPDKAKYTTSFLVHAELPFLLAALVCGAAFIWWHAAVDQAARDHGDMLATPRWHVVGGWLFPGANLVFPIRSLRELAETHEARPAGLIAIPWWACSAAATFVNFFLLRTGVQSSTGPHKNQSGVEGLQGLDKYGVFVGCANLVGALLAVALVWNLTAAVRARVTSPG